MITYMEINTAQLNADIRELEAGTVKVRNSLQGLKGEMEELNGMWKGQANMAFRRQVKLDCSLISALLEKMDRLAGCMAYAANEYVRCEQEIKNALDDIRIKRQRV